MAATSAFAETVTKTQTPVALPLAASIELDFAENTVTNKTEATATIGLDFASTNGLAFGGFEFDSVDGGNLTLGDYHVGVVVGEATVSYGEQGGLLPEAIAAAGFDALNDPNAAMTESLQVSAMGASVALGLTDVTTDVTDVANVQAAYTVNMPALDFTAAVDYNTTTEKYIWGGRAAGELAGTTAGLTATYAAEVMAFEADVTMSGVTAYLNGDENDATQNAGVEWSKGFDGLTLTADANYNFDSSDVTPGVNLSFNF
jgi:hypothetical protein